jgi:hypothetical protein
VLPLRGFRANANVRFNHVIKFLEGEAGADKCAPEGTVIVKWYIGETRLIMLMAMHAAAADALMDSVERLGFE